MKTNVQLSSEEDLPLLHFLWQWKVSTTAALCARFYPKRSLRQGYERLVKLERGDLIQAHILGNGIGFAWGLTKRGFDTVRSQLPELRADGYQSESKEHDLLVSAIHLGEWLKEIPTGTEIFSEQELRCFDLSVYPWWVPQTEIHRPDGYWYIPSGDDHNTIALEVELTQKRTADYDKTAIFYDRQRGISKAIWVIKRPSLAIHIHSRMNESTKHGDKHNFIALVDFLKKGWQAEIQLGPDRSKTVSCLLSDCLRIPVVPVRGQPVLDIRKSPHKSKSYRFLNFGENCDWKDIVPNSAPPTVSSSQFSNPT